MTSNNPTTVEIGQVWQSRFRSDHDPGDIPRNIIVTAVTRRDARHGGDRVTVKNLRSGRTTRFKASTLITRFTYIETMTIADEG